MSLRCVVNIHIINPALSCHDDVILPVCPPALLSRSCRGATSLLCVRFHLPANWTDCSSVSDSATCGNRDTRTLPLILFPCYFRVSLLSQSTSGLLPASIIGVKKKIGESDESKWHNSFNETPTLFFSVFFRRKMM